VREREREGRREKGERNAGEKGVSAKLMWYRLKGSSRSFEKST
jgi:hypothetical protein